MNDTRAARDAVRAAETMREIFEDWNSKRAEIQAQIDRHYDEIRRLGVKLAASEDECANRLDREVPGWRALVSAKEAQP